jgi:3-mercaptopyruvate sulfurtransferase SseA
MTDDAGLDRMAGRRARRADLCILDSTWCLPADKRDPRAEYEAGHIPGAVFLDLDDVSDPDSAFPHMLPPSIGSPAGCSRWGSATAPGSSSTTIQRSTPRRAIWWMLKRFGARRVAILDGGLAKWKAEGRPLERGRPPVRQGHFTPALARSGVAEKADMLALVGDGSQEIVDARSPARFSGAEAEPRAGLASGHIPGSKNLPQARLFNPDNEWKRGEALRAAFEEAGIDLAKPMVTTCGSGVTAAVVLFGAHLLGKDDVGSTTEAGPNGAPIRRLPRRRGRHEGQEDRHQAHPWRPPQGMARPAGQSAGPPRLDHIVRRRRRDARGRARSSAAYYGLHGTPTQWALAEALTELEPGAAGTFLYSSGLASMTAALLTVLSPGDELLVTDNVYVPTRRFCDAFLKRFGVSTRYFDPIAGAAIADLFGDRTRAILLESPGSQTMEVQDVPAICVAARDTASLPCSTTPGRLPLLFPALAAGVDITIMAATKYVGGHADVADRGGDRYAGMVCACRADQLGPGTCAVAG